MFVVFVKYHKNDHESRLLYGPFKNEEEAKEKALQLCYDELEEYKIVLIAKDNDESLSELKNITRSIYLYQRHNNKLQYTDIYRYIVGRFQISIIDFNYDRIGQGFELN